MQDKAIAQIGHWQLEKNKELDPVDLYIENMFPGKDYQMLLLVFEITSDNGVLTCKFEKLDLPNVSKDSDSYRDYAYRSGSPNGGDITFSTKISIAKRSDIFINSKKKISKLKVRFSEIENFKPNKETIDSLREAIELEKRIFTSIAEVCKKNYFSIVRKSIRQILDCNPQVKSAGISFLINYQNTEKYLKDFSVIKELIKRSGAESKYKTQDSKSIAKNKRCSVSGQIEKTVYGFAAPFSFSTVDKKGSLSGFFDKDKNWRNYPISSSEAVALELGKRFITENLKGTFYYKPFLIIPHPFVDKEFNTLNKLISLIQISFGTNDFQNSLEKKGRAENRVMKMIGELQDYFSVDLVFFETQNAAFRIKLAIEEVLPSRFKTLFIDAPGIVNENELFKNALFQKGETIDLNFTFQIVKDFFDDKFLDVVQRIFQGKPFSKDFLFERIISLMRKNYNEAKTQEKWTEPLRWSVLKAIMLISYLQQLGIIENIKNYNYMEITTSEKKTKSFNLDGFNEFVIANQSFLDSDIKVGVFAVGVLVRFLFDIQYASLNNTPFENKLRGYKLNPELLIQVYTEALDKIQKYQKSFYVYSDLREIVSQYFVIKQQDMNGMSNNELSFYFVAGLEMGRKFKNEKEDNNQETKL